MNQIKTNNKVMYKIIDKKTFCDNEEFFRKNLGFVYNYDDFKSLENLTTGRYTLTKENFEEIKNKFYDSTFKEIKDNFDDPNYFLSIAIMPIKLDGEKEEQPKIVSIAQFSKYCEFLDIMLKNGYFVDGVETYLYERRKGIAKEVIKNGLEQIKKQDVYLQTWPENKAAINLYKNFGFKPYVGEDLKPVNDKHIILKLDKIYNKKKKKLKIFPTKKYLEFIEIFTEIWYTKSRKKGEQHYEKQSIWIRRRRKLSRRRWH